MMLGLGFKQIGIEQQGAARAEVFECFSGHPVERLGRWMGENLVPSTLRFDLGKKPRPDHFLIRAWKFVHLFDRAFEQFAHHQYSKQDARIGATKGRRR